MWGTLFQLLMSQNGEEQAGKYTAEQKKMLEEIYNKIKAGNFPQLKAEDLPPSEAGQVASAPELRAAQMAAMNKMKEITDSGGFTLEDRAAQNKAMSGVARQNTAQHQRVLESMAQRGVGGSGAELVANLKNNQDSAERASDQGMQTAAAAQKRYYDSIMGRAKMAGDMRSQDFDQDFRAANARDIRNQYNNGQHFQAQQYNAKLPMELLDAQIRASGGMSSFYANQADQTRLHNAGLGVAGREAINGVGGSGGGSSGGYSPPPVMNADESDPYYGWDQGAASDPDEWKGW